MAILSTQIVGELQQIWRAKRWAFETPEDSTRAFDSFCSMLSLVDAAEQRLVLDLTWKYAVYTFSNYAALMCEAITRISTTHIGNANTTYIAPLVSAADDRLHRSKSGHVLPYITKHIALRHNPSLEKLPAFALASVDALASTPEHETRLVIFVDDFIGSADTAVLAVEDFGRKQRRLGDRVITLALVSMQHALERLQDRGIAALAARIAHKGIEQNDSIADKATAYAVVDGIGAKLDYPDNCLRGYKQTEALVTMIRTPDNTFPMYWTPRKNDGGVWPAPFRRDW